MSSPRRNSLGGRTKEPLTSQGSQSALNASLPPTRYLLTKECPAAAGQAMSGVRLVTDRTEPLESARPIAPSMRGEKFFEALLANSGDVLTLLDDQGRYIYHSAAIKEVIGIEPHEVLGIFAADIVHRDDRERVAERIRYCLATPDCRLSENFRLPHVDGSWRWVEADVRNLLDDPDIGGVLVISRDITSRRHIEEHFSIAELTAGFGT